jgi:hypothetical protein
MTHNDATTAFVGPWGLPLPSLLNVHGVWSEFAPSIIRNAAHMITICALCVCWTELVPARPSIFSRSGAGLPATLFYLFHGLTIIPHHTVALPLFQAYNTVAPAWLPLPCVQRDLLWMASVMGSQACTPSVLSVALRLNACTWPT